MMIRALAVAISFVLATPWTAAADPMSDWLASVAQCSAATPLRLGVIGFEPGTLPETAAEAVRFAIQAELNRHPGVQTAAVRDVTRLRGLQEDVLRRVSEAEINRQLREAFLQVDALVFFRVPERSADTVRFRLQALLPEKLDCAPASGPIERPLLAAPALQDIDTKIADAVERMLVGNDPPVQEVTVCPFEHAGEEFSACSAALTDRVLRQLDKARTSPTAVVRSRVLSITRSEPGRCSAPPEGVSARGSIGVDGKRFWTSLEFRRGGAILSTTGRVTIFPQDLGCDGRLLPFLDYVRADARLAEPKLSLRTTKPVYTSRRDFLGIDIKAGADLRLYCWVLAKDQTGYLVLPQPGQEQRAKISSGRTMRYPGNDFGTDPILLGQPFENLFGCFGSAAPLPPALDKAWTEHAGVNEKGEAIELKRDDILRLLEMMRAEPGIVEAYAPIVVR